MIFLLFTFVLRSCLFLGKHFIGRVYVFLQKHCLYLQEFLNVARKQRRRKTDGSSIILFFIFHRLQQEDESISLDLSIFSSKKFNELLRTFVECVAIKCALEDKRRIARCTIEIDIFLGLTSTFAENELINNSNGATVNLLSSFFPVCWFSPGSKSFVTWTWCATMSWVFTLHSLAVDAKLFTDRLKILINIIARAFLSIFDEKEFLSPHRPSL